MTSRERIRCALSRREPDKVPLDLGGTESSGITAMAYNRIRPYLGLWRGKTQVFDPYQQVVKIEDDLRRVLALDTIPLIIEPVRWKPWSLPDGSPCEIPQKWTPILDKAGDWVVRDDRGVVYARMPKDGFYFEPENPPLANATSTRDIDKLGDAIDSSDWPSFADESVDDIAARAKELVEETEYAVVANLQLHLLAGGQGLRGYSNFMMDLVADRAFAHALLERLTEAYIRRCDRYFKAVRGVDVVLVNDDLGTQRGPMMSLELYDEMIWPYQKRLFSYIKKKSGAFILFHSCGSVRRFIPRLIEAGVDALNPVQVSAAEMDSKELKREFGRDITFWGGGCDTQGVLRSGTPDQVREEVRRRVDDFRAGGGFVFVQVHNIQPDVPMENIVAMYQEFARVR